VKTSVVLLATLLFALGVRAEDPKPAPEPPAESAEALAARQAEVGRRLKAIEETMKRISRILAKTDPEKAARLDMAVRRNIEEGNAKKIEEICNYLESNLFQEALNEQKELAKALDRILDILLDRDADRKDTEEKIKQFEQLTAQLESILQQEVEQFHETEKFADPEKTLQRAKDAKTRLEDLIRRQKELIAKTASRATPGADAAAGLKRRLEALEAAQKGARGKSDPAAQEANAKEAEAIAAELRKLAEAADSPDGPVAKHPAQRAADAAARAAKGMNGAAGRMRGGEPFEEAQQGAEQDLREAREALDKLGERLDRDAHGALSRDQERLRKDVERLQKDVQRLGQEAPGSDSGSGELDRAQNEMKQAEQGLEKGNRDGAVPHEEAAKRELENAYKKLQELETQLKKLIELPDYDKQGEKQDATTEKTEELLKKMEQGGGGGQQGAPAPGKGEVENAKKAMQQASRNLRNRSARDANADQKEAVERLQKAKKELEDALRQLREEMQLMLLEAMERRFSTMLQKQRQLSKDTVALNLRVRGGSPSRADKDSAKRISGGEAELAGEAEKALEILREEGTTVVIPDVVEDLKRDFDALAAMIARLETDEYTQQVQRDVETTLEQLIRVIQEEMKRRSDGGEGGQGDGMEGDNEDNLLPTSAELKMLREMQTQVNRRTEFFERKVQAGTQGADQLAEERGRIAEKQGAVGTLTRTMADKLNRQDGEG